jgi:hypothetical protein
MSDEWEKIRQALENPQYKWRTLEGITKGTGYDFTTVVSSLSAHSDLVIKSTIPSTTGQELYTTRDHYLQKSTLWERFESVITNKVQK